MKKIILSLGVLLALSTTANASYDDFKYKKSNINSYMFGIYGGMGYSSLTEESIFEGGINTLYMYDMGTRMNVGFRGAFKYVSDDLDVYDDYKFEFEPYIGYKVNPDINVYVGYGFEFLSEIETNYFIFGLDYFMSEDFIIEAKYKNKSFQQYENIENENILQINAVIPFNFY